MKIKRILSAALVAVLLSAAVLGVIPVAAGAAYSESSNVSKATLSIDEIKHIFISGTGGIPLNGAVR